MSKKKVVKTISLDKEDLDYVQKVAGDLGGVSDSEAIRQIIKYHRIHPANKKEKIDVS